MKKISLLLLSIFTLKSYSGVEPANTYQPYLIEPPNSRTESPVNDVLFNYQWGLYNQEPTIYNDSDDIHSIRIYGKRGVDIGWNRVLKSGLLSDSRWKLNRDVIVAVIDSGLNVTHPDIADNVYRNDVECDKGKIPKGKAKKDNDGNGYKNDCMGWNFTIPTTKNGKPFVSIKSNRPFDDVGHGTHVAGIIAAVSNNGVGVSGLTNKIKILPLKVFSKSENKKKRGPSLTDRVRLALEYAMEKNVDVINISMGWPTRLQTKQLTRTFKSAVKQGITIVAAIGNNEINKQIFPCSLKGVICVGSVDADGKISEFSNYGGHVDVVAPGDNILSLYPQTESPILFSIHGYELKSGTSQASPFVAAMAAVLKGTKPGISNNEIYSRLSLSAKQVDLPASKFVSNGLVDLWTAMNLSRQPLVKPVFKELTHTIYNTTNRTFKIHLPIKNFWKSTSGIKVRVSSLNSKISIKNRSHTIGSLNEGQETSLRLNGVINSLSSDSELKIKVSVSASGQKTQEYFHTLLMSRDLFTDRDLVKYKVQGFEGKVEELKTINDYLREPGDVNFYHAKKQGEEGQVLQVYARQGSHYKMMAQRLLPSALRVLNFYQIDLNYDGIKDYFIRVVSQRKPQKNAEAEYFIDYYYLDKNLRPLVASSKPYITVIDEQILLNVGSLRFYRHTMNNGKSLALPVFMTKGGVPEVDRNPRRSAREQIGEKLRFYYFDLVSESGLFKFQPRVVLNHKSEDVVRCQLKSKFYEEIEPVLIFPTNKEYGRLKSPALMFTVGQEYSRKYFVYNLENPRGTLRPSDIRIYPIGSINIQDYLMSTYTELSGYGSNSKYKFNAGINAIGFFNFINSVSGLFNETGPVMKVNSQRQNKRDHFVNPIHSFKTNSGMTTLYLTKSKVYAKSIVNGKELDSEVIYSISAFLPGKIFKQFMYPIVVKSREGFQPGFFVNDTQFNGKHIFARVVSNGEIKTPLKLDVFIPEHCRSKNPVALRAGGEMYFSVMCQKNKQVELNLLPIKL